MQRNCSSHEAGHIQTHHASSRHFDVWVTFDAKGFAKRATAHRWILKVQAFTSPAFA
jgi:hypothetical protein